MSKCVWHTLQSRLISLENKSCKDVRVCENWYAVNLNVRKSGRDSKLLSFICFLLLHQNHNFCESRKQSWYLDAQQRAQAKLIKSCAKLSTHNFRSTWTTGSTNTRAVKKQEKSCSFALIKICRAFTYHFWVNYAFFNRILWQIFYLTNHAKPFQNLEFKSQQNNNEVNSPSFVLFVQ